MPYQKLSFGISNIFDNYLFQTDMGINSILTITILEYNG